MPTGDFEFIVSGEELLRVANDGTGTMGSVWLGMFAGGVTQIGVGIVGDYLNGSHQAGHGIVIVSQIGNATTYPFGYPARSLVLGQYNTFQFRIRRVGSAVFVAYKVAADTTWTEAAISSAFPAAALTAPVITIGAGDSGGTTANSRFKAKLDFVTLTGN